MKIYCNRQPNRLIDKIAGTDFWVKCKISLEPDDLFFATTYLNIKSVNDNKCILAMLRLAQKLDSDEIQDRLDNHLEEGELISDNQIRCLDNYYYTLMPELYTAEEILDEAEYRGGYFSDIV